MRFRFLPLLIIALGLPFQTLAADLVLPGENVKFSTSTFLEGKTVRIYATVTSMSKNDDLRGVVRFFDNGAQIQGDQPVSVLAGRDDAVFVDWIMTPGDHSIKITVLPFDGKDENSSNNTVIKQIVVLADTDRDGIPNRDDSDDDNDGAIDGDDAFPLDRSETLDSDGDTIGNNKDDDDDNDGVKDAQDALPLNPNETLDTDKDGVGNNEDIDDDGDGLSDADELVKGTDLSNPDTDGDSVNDGADAYPLDPTQAYDYDKDGVSDAKDSDADNDGIAKEFDVNDINRGPEIIITTDKNSPDRVVSPGEEVKFESTSSFDPDDDKISGTEWNIEGKKFSGSVLKTSFSENGLHSVSVKVTDAKGESREKTFTVLVVPPLAGWMALIFALVILALAIILTFSYSKRRAHESRHTPKILRKR